MSPELTFDDPVAGHRPADVRADGGHAGHVLELPAPARWRARSSRGLDVPGCAVQPDQDVPVGERRHQRRRPRNGQRDAGRRAGPQTAADGRRGRAGHRRTASNQRDVAAPDRPAAGLRGPPARAPPGEQREVERRRDRQRDEHGGDARRRRRRAPGARRTRPAGRRATATGSTASSAITVANTSGRADVGGALRHDVDRSGASASARRVSRRPAHHPVGRRDRLVDHDGDRGRQAGEDQGVEALTQQVEQPARRSTSDSGTVDDRDQHAAPVEPQREQRRAAAACRRSASTSAEVVHRGVDVAGRPEHRGVGRAMPVRPGRRASRASSTPSVTSRVLGAGELLDHQDQPGPPVDDGVADQRLVVDLDVSDVGELAAGPRCPRPAPCPARPGRRSSPAGGAPGAAAAGSR